MVSKRRSIVHICTPLSHTVSKYEQVRVVFLQIKPPLTFVTNPVRLVTKSRHPLIWHRSWAVIFFFFPSLAGCTYPLATLVNPLTRNTRFFQPSYYHCQNNGYLNVKQMGVENVSFLPTFEKGKVVFISVKVVVFSWRGGDVGLALKYIRAGLMEDGWRQGVVSGLKTKRFKIRRWTSFKFLTRFVACLNSLNL